MNFDFFSKLIDWLDPTYERPSWWLISVIGWLDWRLSWYRCLITGHDLRWYEHEVYYSYGYCDRCGREDGKDGVQLGEDYVNSLPSLLTHAQYWLEETWDKVLDWWRGITVGWPCDVCKRNSRRRFTLCPTHSDMVCRHNCQFFDPDGKYGEECYRCGTKVHNKYCVSKVCAKCLTRLP